MQDAYALDETEKRKLRFLYGHSGIDKRYSAIPDFSGTAADAPWMLPKPGKESPSLEERMEVFDRVAVGISVEAIQQCIAGWIVKEDITHLITVSCTGMSAPGLDLQIMETMQLSPNIFRTSVNFMGCYAAIHGLKLGKLICDSTPGAKVIIVATELCTVHFQDAYTADNVASSLLFGDGAAAVLLSNSIDAPQALSIKDFYAHVAQKGKSDMAWQLHSKGFQMRLSGYIPHLIESDIEELVNKATAHNGRTVNSITHWCIHPGGKRILDVIEQKLKLGDQALTHSRNVLKQYGNMSSPTILFVLKEMMEDTDHPPEILMGMAFGPGLTMETFIAEKKQHA